MLNKLKKNIEAIMYDTGQANSDLTRTALSALANCYKKVMTIRESLYLNEHKKRYSLPCSVISVGNITVGGTGKTPMVIYLARLIKKQGHQPVVVSRGYGGTLSGEGGIVSDGKSLLMSSDQSGDEPYLIAEKLLEDSVPVVIGSQRYEAGMEAVSAFNPDVVILDDGFQHMKLKRDLDILLFDAKNPLGNGSLLPRGTLREPVTAAARADLFVLTRVENGKEASALQHFRQSVSENLMAEKLSETPVFTSAHKPSVIGRIEPGLSEPICTDDVDRNSVVYAFSGIAKNHEFRKTVTEMGFRIAGYAEFEDHYCYSDKDCSELAASAKRKGATALITTEKDQVKLREFNLDLPLIIIGVEIDFGIAEKKISDLFKNALRNP